MPSYQEAMRMAQTQQDEQFQSAPQGNFNQPQPSTGFQNQDLGRKTVSFNQDHQIRNYERDEPPTTLGEEQWAKQPMPNPDTYPVQVETQQQETPSTQPLIDENGKYIVPEREGFTYGIAGMTESAREIEEAAKQRKFNRRAPREVNLPEDGVD